MYSDSKKDKQQLFPQKTKFQSKKKNQLNRHFCAEMKNKLCSSRLQNSLQLYSLPLTVANKVSILTGIDVVVNGDQELLVVLEGTGKLLHQLPQALQELIDDGRNLFGVSIQVAAPAEKEDTLDCKHSPNCRQDKGNRFEPNL